MQYNYLNKSLIIVLTVFNFTHENKQNKTTNRQKLKKEEINPMFLLWIAITEICFNCTVDTTKIISLRITENNYQYCQNINENHLHKK